MDHKSSRIFSKESHVVEEVVEKRLSDYCVGIFDSISSRKGIKKAIKKGWIFIDGRSGQSGDWVKKGMRIELIIPRVERSILDSKIEVPIVYEDEYLAVLDKPRGLLVSGYQKNTLKEYLPTLLKRSSQPDALQFPEPIHRLDRETSGVLLIGKTRKVTALLNQAFEARKVEKKYQARVHGEFPLRSRIQLPIRGKSALTVARKIESNGNRSLLEVQIETGRKHQIRIHLSGVGHPVVGDQKYGRKGEKMKIMSLRAVSLRFVHPVSQQMMHLEVGGL